MNLNHHDQIITTRIIRTFNRFSNFQRIEHLILIGTIIILLLTGLPQKYRQTGFSQQLLSTPTMVDSFQNIHHIAAILLIILTLLHITNAIRNISNHSLNADIFPNFRDIKDAWHMVKHLLFLTDKKPENNKYNFEQKITYWFIFFGIGIMGVTGVILWFPELITRFLPGGLIPASKLAHSSEAIVLLVFILLWHFYHVHLERFNLSIFSGMITEEELKQYHSLEYDRTISKELPSDPHSENKGSVN